MTAIIEYIKPDARVLSSADPYWSPNDYRITVDCPMAEEDDCPGQIVFSISHEDYGCDYDGRRGSTEVVAEQVKQTCSCDLLQAAWSEAREAAIDLVLDGGSEVGDTNADY